MDSLPEKPKSVGQQDEAATPGPTVATVISPEGPRITDPTVVPYVQSQSTTVSIPPDLSKMGVQPLGDAISHPGVEIAQPATFTSQGVVKKKPTDRDRWLGPILEDKKNKAA